MDITHLNDSFMEAFRWTAQSIFYKQIFQQHGIEISDIASIKDIVRLPILNKQNLREAFCRDRNPLSEEDLEYIFTSSGTTGKPTPYFWSHTDTEVLRESGCKAMSRVGVKRSDRAMIIAPMGMPVMWFCMLNQYNSIGAGVIPYGASSADQILEGIREFDPTILTSLPVVGTRLAEYAHMNRVVDIFRVPRTIHCGGDFLSNGRRKRIETFWGGSCYNFFGISELFGPIAGECEYKNGMHLMQNRVLMEVVNPATLQPVQEGEVGLAVFTALWKKGSPVIRYCSNDYVYFDYASCPCGDPSPRLFFVGRPPDMGQVNGRTVFAQEIEEIIFRYPEVGNEFHAWLFNDNLNGHKAIIELEMIPGAQVPTSEICQVLEDHFSFHIELVVRHPGSISRIDTKPCHITMSQ